MCHAVKSILITISGALHCCMYIPSKVRQIAVICCILHNLALRTDLCNSSTQLVVQPVICIILFVNWVLKTLRVEINNGISGCHWSLVNSPCVSIALYTLLWIFAFKSMYIHGVYCTSLTKYAVWFRMSSSAFHGLKFVLQTGHGIFVTAVFPMIMKPKTVTNIMNV